MQQSLHVDYCSQCFTYINSLNPYNNLVIQVLLLSPVTGGYTEAQRGDITGPMSNDWEMVKLRFEPKKDSFRKRYALHRQAECSGTQ